MTDQKLAKLVDELASKEAIRECVARIVRGIDRLDMALLRTAFHEDAKVQWHSKEPLPLEAFLEGSSKIKNFTREAQHLVGNVLIELDGDTAKVESYEIGRHLTKMGEEWKDLIIASRYLDKFSRRNGEWKIDYRMKLMDWARVMEGSDQVYENAVLKARRDSEDLSYQILGSEIFR